MIVLSGSLFRACMSRRHRSLFGLAVAGFVFMSSGCAELMSGAGAGSNGQAARKAPAAKAGGDETKVASKSGVYAVTFGVKRGAGRLGAVQFEARPRAAGRWQGTGAKVACTSLAGPAMHACNDKGGVLSCGLIDTNGIATPTDLVTCGFESSTPVSAADFSVKVVDASNTATKPVTADVGVTRVTPR